jgi:hypothetical protein
MFSTIKLITYKLAIDKYTQDITDTVYSKFWMNSIFLPKQDITIWNIYSAFCTRINGNGIRKRLNYYLTKLLRKTNRLQFYAIQNMVSSRKPLEQIYKRNSRELFSFEIFLSILYLLFLILQWWINRSWISCSPYSFLYYFLLVRYKIIHKPSPCLSC